MKKFNFTFKDYLIEILGQDFDKEFNEQVESYYKSVDDIYDEISFLLRTHLFVENQLDKFIEEILPNGNKLLRDGNLTFKQKILILQSFGTVDFQLLDVVKRLNDTRNELAHNISYKIDEEILDDIGRPLGKLYSNLIKGKHFQKFEEDIKGRNVKDEITIKLRILFTYVISQFNDEINNSPKYTSIDNSKLS